MERDPDDLKDTLRRIARRTGEAAEQQVLGLGSGLGLGIGLGSGLKGQS